MARRPYPALIRIARRLEAMFGGTISNDPPLIRIAQALEGGQYSDERIAALETRIGDLETRVEALEGSQASITVTVKIDGVATAGIDVTATKGETVLTGTTGEDGTYRFHVGVGEWTIEGVLSGTEYYDITDAEVTVEAGDAATANVTAKAILPDALTVKTPATKLVYDAGDPVDTTGLVLTVTYTDGSTKDISEGFTATPAEIAADTTSITVSYTEGDVTVNTGYDITVNEG